MDFERLIISEGERRHEGRLREVYNGESNDSHDWESKVEGKEGKAYKVTRITAGKQTDSISIESELHHYSEGEFYLQVRHAISVPNNGQSTAQLLRDLVNHLEKEQRDQTQGDRR